MAEHTPGPWERVPQNSGGDLIARPYETGNQMSPKGLRLVAHVMARGNSLKEDDANARLIAAAPTLLLTAKLLLQNIVFEEGGDLSRAEFDAMFATAESVIARAEGR